MHVSSPPLPTHKTPNIQLNDEITGMKRQKMDLLHKMDAERRKFQVLLREKTQEIESMRRAAQ